MPTSCSRPIADCLSDSVPVLKAELALVILTSIDRQGLTVREAQAKTGQPAADFSRLRRGQLQRFTLERLLVMADGLGERISLALRVDAPALQIPTVFSVHARALRVLCRRFGVQRLAAFGSVVRADFDPRRSDIDLTVQFFVSEKYGPADQYFRMKTAVELLFGCQVDLVELHAMPTSRLKKAIERSQITLYEQTA